ncbi:MAG TPA: hypothetical protein PLJ46_09520 [Burkholderiaceae bacterium]|jgi:hypothetical protein|nr:hypothetical protein [Burkholderiaceae bacterium]
MIENSLSAWTLFLAIAGIASLAGISVSRWMPWSGPARKVRLPLACGLILGPFLTGLATVLAMRVMPGAQSWMHIAFVCATLSLLCLLSLRKQTEPGVATGGANSGFNHSRLLWLLLALWCLALLVNTVFVPLSQNDSLEYATVGRMLYATRTLDAYPALNSANNLSGFYGPWTHPPLYVSLIYLSSAVQGHANAPGLMRLIAPWFLLCATSGIVALGSLRRPNVGIVAGILFISTPLLFLGADSSLIDALPVAGMVLLLVLLSGLTRHGWGWGAWLGLGLGLSLWSHSQAILFAPLLGACMLLLGGLRRWQVSARDFVVVIAVALVIAGWPYLKNVAIFGTPISDNPAVFALRSLDWQGYFRFARGLDTWPAIVQYGVFKGWFSLQSYGLNFWLMSMGLYIFWSKTVRGNFIATLRNGVDQLAPTVAIIWLAAGLTVAYILGVVLSTLLGIDLMIRNDRYLLVIMPPVVIGAAYGVVELGRTLLHRLTESQRSPWPADIAIAGIWIALTISTTQLVLVGWHYRWREVPPSPSVSILDESVIEETKKERFDRILDYWSAFRTVREMASHVPGDALVLTMRPADMYYSGRTMLSYLDPRLLPVYRETSPVQAVQMLHDMGVQYVHMVDYSLPSLYNSVLQGIMDRPDLSRLEYGYGMTQIYSLRDSGLRKGAQIDITPGKVPWIRSPAIRTVGKNAFGGFKFGQTIMSEQKDSVSTFPLFHRDYSVELITRVGDSSWSGSNKQPNFEVNPGSEYLLDLQLQGRGFVQIWLTQLDAKRNPIDNEMAERDSSIRIGEIALTEQYPAKNFARRFKAIADAKMFQITVEHVGESHLTIGQATLIAFVPDKANHQATPVSDP